MSVAIHNIDIKKPKTNEEISFIQKLFNDKLSPKIKEMANKYRLQQLPKTKFVGGSMKTMKQGKHISIKYGQLKPECEHLCPDMEGKGLFDFIKSKAKDLYSGLKSGVSKVFSTRLDDYNNTTKETLRKYGDMNIDNLMIYRTPVNSMIDKALNIFSFGKFAEMKKKYGFDEFFHLALVAQVKGKNVIIEKNEVINVSTSYNTNDRTETMKVEMKRKPLTINQLLNATREKQTPDDYFSYDAFNNNCQMFIRALLRNVDLYTKDIDGFLFQNVENLIKEMPTLAKVAKTATDIGAWFNKITGQGGYVDMFGKYYPDSAGYYMNRNRNNLRGGMKGQEEKEEEPEGPEEKESDEEQIEGQPKKPKKPKKKQEEGDERPEGQPKKPNDGGMIDPPRRELDLRRVVPSTSKELDESLLTSAKMGLRTLMNYREDLIAVRNQIPLWSFGQDYQDAMTKINVRIAQIEFKYLGLNRYNIQKINKLKSDVVNDLKKTKRRNLTLEEVLAKLPHMIRIGDNTINAMTEYKPNEKKGQEGQGKPCKYCSIMKGLGDLNRLYNGSGQATGFIRVLMANKDKKGDRRRNRRGQLLPNFDLDADYKASVDVIKTNKKATKHKKYFKDLSVLEDKEQMREKGYNPARSYYDINHEVRDGYDRRGQQNREAGARWRARNREAERERQKKKREERRQRVGSGKKVIPAVVENILMSIKPKKEAV